MFATASGKEGVELVLEMGAHAAVDGKRVDIDDQARRFAPDSVDACWLSPVETRWSNV